EVLASCARRRPLRRRRRPRGLGRLPPAQRVPVPPVERVGSGRRFGRHPPARHAPRDAPRRRCAGPRGAPPPAPSGRTPGGPLSRASGHARAITDRDGPRGRGVAAWMETTPPEGSARPSSRRAPLSTAGIFGLAIALGLAGGYLDLVLLVLKKPLWSMTGHY